MVSDKRLFEIMIKYHPIFIGWLLYKEKIEKKENSLIVRSSPSTLSQQTLITEYTGEVYHTYNNGVRRIPYSGSWDGQPDFTKISGNIDIIISRGFDIFDLWNTSDRYCLTSQVEKILINCYDAIFDISLSDKTPRLNGKATLCYIKWLEKRHEYLKNNNYEFGLFSKWGYLGLSGFSAHQPKVIENIIKHGIFAYTPIYKRLEWSFDLVDQYKGQIVWKLLIEESNLLWNEEMLMKYDKYIPFCTDNQETYCDKFNSENVLTDYSVLGLLHKDYIENHKDKLDWRAFFDNGKFDLSAEEFSYFCDYALHIDISYSSSFKRTTASSQIEWNIVKTIDNPNITWTPELLMSYLCVSNYCWEELVKKHRPQLFKVFLSIPNIKKIAEPYAANIKNFWEIITNPHTYPYDELTKIFTVDNIKLHKEDWSVPLATKYSGMRRTPDTNYYWYDIETQWDIFIKKNNIPLTYELAKLLKETFFKIGGGYMESDGGYMESDNRFPIVNGLMVFSHHHFASKKDLLRCIEDDEIADILLKQHNIDIVNYITDMFFKDYSIERYIELINSINECVEIDEFYYFED